MEASFHKSSYNKNSRDYIGINAEDDIDVGSDEENNSYYSHQNIRIIIDLGFSTIIDNSAKHEKPESNQAESNQDENVERLDNKDDEKIIDDPSIRDHSSKMASESHEENPPELTDTSEFDKPKERENIDSDSSQEEVTYSATPPVSEDGGEPTIDELEEFDLGT
ncbi:hypothetical protein ACLOJK_025574 [Asimina triloba]